MLLWQGGTGAVCVEVTTKLPNAAITGINAI